MAVRGIFTSHSNIVGDRVGDLASRVLKYMPQGSAPLLALSSGMQKKRATDTAFSWIEDDHISGATTAVGTVNSSVTSFVVADSNLWVPNTIIINTVTGEKLLVTAVTGNTITVVRGIAGTTAAAITDTDFLHNAGTAFGEGSGKPTPVAQRGESRTNYCQIFKNGWAITGTAEAIGWHSGSQLAKNRSQAMSYHVEDIEKAFVFGSKGYMHVDGRAVFLSDGAYTQVEQYGGLVEAAATGGTTGNMSMEDLRDFLRRIFLTNVSGVPNERISFTSSLVLQNINTMARLDSTYNVQQGSEKDTFGFAVTTIVGINGRLKLMTHPLFDLFNYNDLLVLHPQFISKRELRPIETAEFNRQKANSNGFDQSDGYILSHLGFEVGGTKTMGILQDINNPVASF